jgi:hypothetical protein
MPSPNNQPHESHPPVYHSCKSHLLVDVICACNWRIIWYKSLGQFRNNIAHCSWVIGKHGHVTSGHYMLTTAISHWAWDWLGKAICRQPFVTRHSWNLMIGSLNHVGLVSTGQFFCTRSLQIPFLCLHISSGFVYYPSFYFAPLSKFSLIFQKECTRQVVYLWDLLLALDTQAVIGSSEL